jgi:gas vesicle protein
MEDRSNGHDSGKVGSGASGIAMGIMIGALLGGIAVVLYAPQSGSETRNALRTEINDTQCMLQSWAAELTERVNRFVEIFRLKTDRTQIPSK